MPDPDSRLVYSTDGGRVGEKSKSRPVRPRVSQTPAPRPLPADGVVRIQREKKGRGGKTVTVVTGLPGGASELDALLKDLKQHCGAGGTRDGAVLEIQGPEDRLDERGDHVPVAGEDSQIRAGRGRHALSEPLADAEPPPDDRAAGAADDVRPHLREPALGEVREALVELLGDGQVEHRVTEELEPLVRVGAVLDEGRVRERALAQPAGQALDQREELCSGVVARVARSERRCTRRHARRSVCPGRPRRRS